MAVLGTVVAINGEASVIDEKGIKKPLHLGDLIQPGDTVVTMPGVVVELELVTGRKVEITSEQTVKFTQELVDVLPPDSGNSAVDQATVQAVIKAIAEGKDINEVLEETAAGLAGGAGNSYGFSFVDLMRITEGVNPGSYEYDSPGRVVPPVIDPAYQLDTGNPGGAGGGTGQGADPVISISGPGTVDESAGTVTYTVTLSGPSGNTVTVNYGTSSSGPGMIATPGADFTATNGTLTFAPGVTSLTFTVPILDDQITETDESFTVSLVSPVNASIGVATATTTIIDNDPLAIATVSSPTIAEGGNLDFTVTFNNPAAAPTAITLTPASGTGTLGVDTGPLQVSFDGGVTFVPLVGNSVTVPTNATGLIVRVPTLIDGIDEPNETITLGVSAPANPVPVVGTGTIIDIDAPPTLSIAGPPTINESAGTATYTVTLSGPSPQTVKVSYGTDNSGSATSPNDYTETQGTLTFAPGVTSLTFTVPIINDQLSEAPETFSVGLVAPVNASIAVPTATTIIIDDDAGISIPDTNLPGIADGDFTIPETNGATPGSFTITPPTGISTLVVGGTVLTSAQLNNLATTPVTINTGEAILVLTGYDNSTGVVSYTYDPSVQTNVGGAPIIDSIVITVTDSNGNTATITLDANITDSIPVAVADGASIAEDGPVSVSGNVYTNDDIGGDTRTNPVTAASVTLAHGTLVLNTNGSYTYTLNNGDPAVNALNTGDALTDSYVYTITDADGSTSTATLTLTINGTNDAAVITPAVVNLVETDAVLTTGGTLVITDVDSPSTFVAQTNVPGSNGYGNFTLGSDGVWTYVTTTPHDEFVAGTTYTDTLTVTSADGVISTITVNIDGTNDAPVNIVPGAQSGTEDTAIVFSSGNGNAVTVGDIDSSSLTSSISVLHGTLSLGSTAGVTVTGNGSGTVLITGSSAAINAALEGLTYSPSANYSGNESLSLHTTDGALTADSIIPIALVAVADVPALSTSTITYTDTPSTALPVSNGLQLGYYSQPTVINKTIASNITNFENALDAAPPTTTSTVTNVSVANATTGDAYRYTGYVYLQAGHTYDVSGYRDDTLEVKLGGTLVYGVGHNNWGNFTANTYTAAVSGYYSLEIDYFNGDGIGSLSLSVSDNGAPPLALNTSNFHLYTSSSVVVDSGVDLGTFVTVTDGGYFPMAANNPSSISINSITTSLTDKDGSESLAVTVGAIPEGAILTDGTHFFTSASGATTATVTGWDLHNIFLMPGSTSISSATLTVTSTSTESSNGDQASATEDLLFTVGSASYQSGTAAANTMTGSAGDDVLVGAAGNDTISGGNGNDVLIGGTGNDSLLGNAGGDIIWGGSGSDTLTGGNSGLQDIVSDVFVWRLGDQGSAGSPAVDVITDFGTGAKSAGGDVLDLKDLLIGESANASSLQDYLHFEVSGSDTIVHISNTGGFSADSHSVGGTFTSAAETQQIVLSGVDVTAMYTGATTDAAIISNLLTNNKLVTD